MSGRSSLVASAEQKAALRALAGSSVRGEADRARAMPLMLAGWTAGEIGEAFGTTEDAGRRWRGWFTQGGVDALRSTMAPGPSPERGERALACARELLAVPVQDRLNWTLPRLRAEIKARPRQRPSALPPLRGRIAWGDGVRLSQSHLSVLLRKGASAGAGPGTA